MRCLCVGFAILLAGFTVQASVIVNYGAAGGADMFASANHNPKVNDTFTPGAVFGDETTHSGSSVALPESQTYNGAAVAKGAISISKDLSAALGSGGDNIFIQDAATASLDGMVVWENFAGSDTTLETLSMGARHIGNASIFRYVIEKDNGDSTTSWYASDVIITGGLSYQTDSASSAAALTWYDFVPLNGDAGSVGGSAVSIDMTDVTSVGAYFNVTRTSNGNTGIKMNYFNATAVPEPATFGLLAIFGGALLTVRRRHANRA